MRALPQTRLRPTLLTRADPTPAGGRLLARRWLYPITVAPYGPRAVTVDPPRDAEWCVARTIGSGGGYYSLFHGGGACFARRLFRARRGQPISASIAGWDPAVVVGIDGQATTVSIAGVVVCKAAGGKAATASAPGAAGDASACVGDVIRPGTAAAPGAPGVSGSDLQDPDTLQLGGVQRREINANPGRVTDGTAPPIPTDYGAGANPIGEEWRPASPSDSNWTPTSYRAGPGVCVLEFYDRRPY